MANNWTSHKLGDVCEINRLKRDNNWYYPIIEYIDISSVGVGHFVDRPSLISIENAPSRAQRLVQDGDTILSTVRPNRRSMLYIKSPQKNTVVSTGFAVLHPKNIDSRFLYYAIFDQEFTEYLTARADGSAYPAVSPDVISDAEIDLPPLPEQRAIAGILGALDDKIELNRRMNRTLESLARAVFRQWFVEGEDVAGWKVGKLGDVAQNIRRSANADEIDPETHYIGLEHMPRRSISLSEWGNASELASNKFRFKEGEFLFGKLRPYFHKVGIAPIDGVCSTDILVIAPKSSQWYGLVLGHISSTELINFTSAASTGTKMPRTNWADIESFEILIPPEEKAKEFNKIFLPMVSRIRANIMESRTLASLRDSLLPKLMRGEVRVRVT